MIHKPQNADLRELERGIKRRLLRHVQVSLRRQFAIWALCSLAVWGLANAVFLLAAAPREAATGLALFLASLLPAFLLWPESFEALTHALRCVDPDTVIEAWLDAPRGPAKEILARRVAERSALLARERSPREKARAGLRPLALAAAASIALFEAVALATHGTPLTIAVPREPVIARHDDEKSFAAPEEADQAARDEFPKPFETERVQDRPEASPPRGSANEARADRERGAEARKETQLALESASNSAPDAEEDMRRSAEIPRDASRATDPGMGAVHNASSQASRDSENRGKSAAPTGWEAADESLVRSPLVDYRARFFRVLAERTRMEVEAGERLSLAELRSYERRYFTSFSLPAGIVPREDAFAALLKRRWRELFGEAR